MANVPLPPGSPNATDGILDWYVVTPDDDEDLPVVPRAILLSDDGEVKMDSFSKKAEGVTVFLRGGVWHPMRPSRIHATGLTDGVTILAGY